jgi:hypothetical protein
MTPVPADAEQMVQEGQEPSERAGRVRQPGAASAVARPLE